MNIYTNFKAKQFKFLTISNCLLADGAIIYYIYKKMGNKAEFMQSMKLTTGLLKQMKQPIDGVLYPGFEQEMWLVFIKTLVSILVFYLFLHSIIYLFHFFDKKWATGYMKLYSWTAGVLMMVFGLIQIPSALALFIIPASLLLFNAFGFKHFKNVEQ